MAAEYHHGNLRKALLEEAENILVTEGIGKLSVRRLADTVGVSRSALYHHFKDKNSLLCAITTQQFQRWDQNREAILQQEHTSCELIRAIVESYLSSALETPALYNLMFGETLWLQSQPSEELQQVASHSFQKWVELIDRLQQQGFIEDNQPALRMAQISWAMMHGLARLLIDGVYVDRKQIAEMSQAVSSLLAK